MTVLLDASAEEWICFEFLRHTFVGPHIDDAWVNGQLSRPHEVQASAPGMVTPVAVASVHGGNEQLTPLELAALRSRGR
jgi:hypothetical protein